jgi:hypothetical protein
MEAHLPTAPSKAASNRCHSIVLPVTGPFEVVIIGGSACARDMIELGNVDLGFGQTIRGFLRLIAPPSGAMPEGKPIVKRTEWALEWNERNYITNIRFPKPMLSPMRCGQSTLPSAVTLATASDASYT